LARQRRGRGRVPLRSILSQASAALAPAGTVRYSPGRTNPGVAGMIAILTIVIFVAVIAGLNFIEFGRVD
jgi:hypothetical protein